MPSDMLQIYRNDETENEKVKVIETEFEPTTT